MLNNPTMATPGDKELNYTHPSAEENYMAQEKVAKGSALVPQEQNYLPDASCSSPEYYANPTPDPEAEDKNHLSFTNYT